MAWSVDAPASGPGWGGPARGAGRDGPARPGNRGHKGNPLGRGATGEKKLRNDTRSEEMLDLLVEIARHGEHEASRIAAADKVLDRLEGKPKQAVDVTTDGRPMGYVNVPPVAKTMEEWEAMARAKELERKAAQ